MLLRATLLLSAVAAVLAQEQFFKKYAFTKVMTECFGDDLYYTFLARVAQLERQCKYSPIVVPSHIDVSSLPFPTVSRNVGDTRPQQFPARIPTTFVHQPGFAYIPPAPPGYVYTRTKRQAGNTIFDREAIHEALYEVMSSLSNFTCVLHGLEDIDDNLNIRYDTAINAYNEANIDSRLREDLLNGISECRDLVSCLPVEKKRVPITPKLLRIMAFVKCEKKSRLAACLKHDIRKNINIFDINALPNDGGRTGVVEKLMTILVGSESADELEIF